MGEKQGSPPSPPDDPNPFDRLARIMALLRSDLGCPWDRAQDHESMKAHLIEETYEAVEAIESGDPGALREELGDVLFLVFFLAQLSREKGDFDVHQVAEGAAAKMVRRHPHVFRDAQAETPADVLVHWEESKSRERGEAEGSVLDGLPHALPALQRAQRVQDRASGLGFDWADPDPVLEKIEEEVRELRQALGRRGDVRDAREEAAPGGPQRDRVEEELGDLLFAAVNLARLLGLNAEETLRAAVAKFARRFRAVERARAAAGGKMTLEEMDRVWEEEKRKEREG